MSVLNFPTTTTTTTTFLCYFIALCLVVFFLLVLYTCRTFLSLFYFSTCIHVRGECEVKPRELPRGHNLLLCSVSRWVVFAEVRKRKRGRWRVVRTERKREGEREVGWRENVRMTNGRRKVYIETWEKAGIKG